MIRKLCRYGLLMLLSAACFWLAIAPPSQAHWADLATAEIIMQAAEAKAEAQISLTYPTRLTAFADDDVSGQLSDTEISRHQAELQTFFQERIQLKGIHITNSQRQLAALSVGPRSDGISPSGQAAPTTHTGIQLTYKWPSPVQGVEIDYNLFLPEAPKATCLATISQAGQFTSHVFTPKDTTLALAPPGSLLGNGKWALTLIGVFAWGAAHSMSPGHGKTLVGAYLVGERATPLHAIFLAMTTTVTHTLGVFALGLVTLFAARYVLPEQLYPWLSLVSGAMVMSIGVNLLWQRSRRQLSAKTYKTHHPHDHGHHDHGHHDHGHHNHGHHNHGHHDPTHEHPHTHGLSSGQHSHLPAKAEEPITWRRLWFLGLSAGLVPCPAALVLLLGAIALGNPASGLLLVLVFSLGLSLVLTALGLC